LTNRERKYQEVPVRRLLRSKELAEAFGLEDNTLRIWRAKGEGPPHYKIGKSVRYDQEKVREWLEDREREGR
jgi:predicted DNA-binding transcriptional regulator AlpA